MGSPPRREPYSRLKRKTAACCSTGGFSYNHANRRAARSDPQRQAAVCAQHTAVFSTFFGKDLRCSPGPLPARIAAPSQKEAPYGPKNRTGRSKNGKPYSRTGGACERGRNLAHGCDPFRYFSGNSPGNLSPGILFPKSARAREFQANARLTPILRPMPYQTGKYLARGCKRRCRSRALLWQCPQNQATAFDISRLAGANSAPLRIPDLYLNSGILRPATLLLLFPAKPAASRAVLQSIPNPDSLRPYSIFLGKSRYGSMHFTSVASHFRPYLRNSPTTLLMAKETAQ